MATPFSVEISVEVSGAHFLSQATRDAVKHDLENQMQTYGLYPRPRVTWIDDTHVSIQIVVDGAQDRAGEYAMKLVLKRMMDAGLGRPQDLRASIQSVETFVGWDA